MSVIKCSRVFFGVPVTTPKGQRPATSMAQGNGFEMVFDLETRMLMVKEGGKVEYFPETNIRQMTPILGPAVEAQTEAKKTPGRKPKA